MAKDLFQCVVSADLFRRASLAVSTDAGRYYLQGVHVSPASEGGAVLTATDGALLISVYDPNALVRGEGIVLLNKQSRAALKSRGALLEQRLLAVRATAGRQSALVVDVAAAKRDDNAYSPYEAALALLDAPDARVKAAQFGDVLIDGTFPDWRRVLPDGLSRNLPPAPMDQRLVAKASEAICEFGGAVRLTSSGANSPVLITSVMRPGFDAFAVLMPVRDSGIEGEVPAWARLPQQQAAA